MNRSSGWRAAVHNGACGSRGCSARRRRARAGASCRSVGRRCRWAQRCRPVDLAGRERRDSAGRSAAGDAMMRPARSSMVFAASRSDAGAGRDGALLSQVGEALRLSLGTQETFDSKYFAVARVWSEDLEQPGCAISPHRRWRERCRGAAVAAADASPHHLLARPANLRASTSRPLLEVPFSTRRRRAAADRPVAYAQLGGLGGANAAPRCWRARRRRRRRERCARLSGVPCHGGLD